MFQLSTPTRLPKKHEQLPMWIPLIQTQRRATRKGFESSSAKLSWTNGVIWTMTRRRVFYAEQSDFLRFPAKQPDPNRSFADDINTIHYSRPLFSKANISFQIIRIFWIILRNYTLKCVDLKLLKLLNFTYFIFCNIEKKSWKWWTWQLKSTRNMRALENKNRTM